MLNKYYFNMKSFNDKQKKFDNVKVKQIVMPDIVHNIYVIQMLERAIINTRLYFMVNRSICVVGTRSGHNENLHRYVPCFKSLHK